MNMFEEKKAWYSEWFNSPYYHILYKNRDEKEAEYFLNNLSTHFRFNQEDKILDVACGRGRHAIYLNSIGFDVTGIDLSPENIAYGRQFENEKLHFGVHDMREVFAEAEYDYVLNLFTSFGYFESEQDNYKAVKAIAGSLKPGGKLVIDFMNVEKVQQHLVKCEVKEEGGIKFFIQRKLEDSFFIKNIDFKDEGFHYSFQEKVKAITKSDFIKYFNFAGLSVIETFGDYSLNEYSPEDSDRLIFVLGK